MGVFGLRKYVEATRCERAWKAVKAEWQSSGDGTRPPAAGEAGGGSGGGSNVAAVVQHLIIDFNSVIHSCYSTSHRTGDETVAAVLTYLEGMFRKIVVPDTSLVFCFDGPAPIAKLATQRQRRRKQGHMDASTSERFSDLSFTAGSGFMLLMEQRLSQMLATWSSATTTNDGGVGDNHLAVPMDAANRRPLLPPSLRNVSIIGSTVPGEGEAKISYVLSLIADVRGRGSSCWRDRVVLLGNDIDLVLVAVGATSFLNIMVLNHQSLNAVDVALLVTQRWPTTATSATPRGELDVVSSDGNGEEDASASRKRGLPDADAAAKAAVLEQILGYSTRIAPAAVKTGRKVRPGTAKTNESMTAHASTGGNEGEQDKMTHTSSFAAVPRYNDRTLQQRRLDFVFLFMLNGGDYYEGLGTDAASHLWARYRALLSSDPSLAVVCLDDPSTLHTEGLREVLDVAFDPALAVEGGGGGSGAGKRGRGTERDDAEGGKEMENAHRRSRQKGFAMLNAAMWSLEVTLTGRCLDPSFVLPALLLVYAEPKAKRKGARGGDGVNRADDDDGDHHQKTAADVNPMDLVVGTADLRSALAGLRARFLNVPPGWQEVRRALLPSAASSTGAMYLPATTAVGEESAEPSPADEAAAPRRRRRERTFLTPFQNFVALMPTLTLQPACVRSVLHRHADWRDTLLTPQSSPLDVADTVRRVQAAIDPSTMTPVERFCTQFGEPIDVRGHLLSATVTAAATSKGKQIVDRRRAHR